MKKNHYASDKKRKGLNMVDKTGTLEVDLHIEKVHFATGTPPLEAQMNRFRAVMQQHILKKGKRIVFIHGKGNGILRETMIKALNTTFKSCTYEDAPFYRYGVQGALLVTIH